ncbi:MAG: FAD-binding protein [Gammaproteobacteria bacterium]|nr:FAD-binding protein [Gammaproteobacteria bacterium]MYD76663.1 FAD-binding protein [Gammaproteobacteria bacterium]MYJ53273.1 FAD-binding protein [Gammaproteobacteria bacterium]
MPRSHAIRKDLAGRIRGEVLTGIFDRGRYATDASAYQMMPLAVVIARDDTDVSETLRYAREQSIPVLPRGGGTSQCGQTVNHGIVLDYSKYMNRLIELDPENRCCRVEGGMVLDELNRAVRPHGLWFPVDVSTASRATIGGMAGNNSCGSRSIRYGLMRDNVVGIDALLANGEALGFGQTGVDSGSAHPLFGALLEIGIRERNEIERRFPKVMRRVGGYNIDALVAENGSSNLAHLLVGSEGTLACFRSIDLKLSPLPKHRLLGICHFPTFHAAMDSAQHLVKLGPVAVELIDRTMIDLSRNIPLFRDTVESMLSGEPEALLLVEFAEDDPIENRERLKALGELMSDLGYRFTNPRKTRGGVVEAIDPAFQNSVFEVRKAGLNIMMSMRDDRKPVSFVEDCAVELKDLAEYTDRLNGIFRKHGTRGTWYAHASVGCLHVRPVLDLRQSGDIRAMRAIAEECFDMVLEYRGSHSGEHGDGLCRSEFHEKMFGGRMVETFGRIKNLFDPGGLMNPGKIVNPTKMDDARLFRFPPGYSVPKIGTALDWSGWPGEGGGFQGAVEMCNNNGACRKLAGGVMCPSYRATRDERHVTRGRANVLRLAISGQLGKDAMTSDSMHDAMRLCVSCKACRRECPTGVDMARMKIEVAAARHEALGADIYQKLIAHLPRYAPHAARFRHLSNLPSRSELLRAFLEPLTGMSRRRPLPRWAPAPYLHSPTDGPVDGKPVVLFADTFNTWFEPDNLHAARTVLAAAGYRVHAAAAPRDRRPLCCGRTYLTSGMTGEAKREIKRMLEVLEPFLEQGIPVVGLEPSCILGMRDEIPLLMPNRQTERLAGMSYLFEEFLELENPELDLRPLKRLALVHGHCHQKSFDQMGHVERTLARIPGLEVDTVNAGCCGMAGAFGYGRDTCDVSETMAELDLLPAVRSASRDTLIIADGTSCRHQIELGAGKQAMHVARLMQSALGPQHP